MVNLAGSSQVAPTYWLNPDNGVSYSIVMQTPQYKMDSLSALQTLPITAAGKPQCRRSWAASPTSSATSNAVVSQYDIQPMVQIYRDAAGPRSRRRRRRRQGRDRGHRKGRAEGLDRWCCSARSRP